VNKSPSNLKKPSQRNSSNADKHNQETVRKKSVNDRPQTSHQV